MPQGANWEALNRINKRADDIRRATAEANLKRRITREDQPGQNRQAILEAILSGKVKPREGADLSGLGDISTAEGDFGTTLGNITEALEPVGTTRPYKITSADVKDVGSTVTDEAKAKYPAEEIGGIIQEEGGRYKPKGIRSRILGAITPWPTPTETIATKTGEQREEYIGAKMKPMLQQQKTQFLGGPGTMQLPEENDPESIITQAMEDNPGGSREEVIAALKQKGLLQDGEVQ